MKICRCTVSLFLLVTVLSLSALADDWKPVDPAILRMKQPLVEKDADAEAIFWEIKIHDQWDGYEFTTFYTHYLRIKVFTEHGKERLSTVDLPYFGKNAIDNISGRTIRPDESIVQLKKDAVFDRAIVRASGLKVKAKSFAMPAVEPGAIIEYRWREIQRGHPASYIRLQFQRDFPVQQVKYFIKPLEGLTSLTMKSICFHGKPTPFMREPEGYYSTGMTNMPAFREEPSMPPVNQVRTWMLVYYAEDKKADPEKFWKDLGKKMYEEAKSGMKVNDEVRQAAANIMGDASAPEAKLERLFEFCRTKIKNVNDDASGLTAEERRKLKENRSPTDTLKRGMGNGRDVHLLFAALATAAGFDARPARLSDRSDTFFDPSFADDYFLIARNVAVKVSGEWRFFDPALPFVPYGMLRWQEEGIAALVTDPKDPVFVQTPMSPAAKSAERRTATLKLSEEGTLEGDVRVEYTGHLAAYHKEYNDEDSLTQREETLKERVKGRMSTAELSNIQVENVTDRIKPFVYFYHIRVPGYAQRTGKRLFFQPAFFQTGVSPRFAASTRKFPVYFHYPWSEEDSVTVDLPAGFALESPDSPGTLNAGAVSQYDVRISITSDGRQLIYRRKFSFGGSGVILFTPEQYGPLKAMFDAVHKSDSHTLTLKQDAAVNRN